VKIKQSLRITSRVSLLTAAMTIVGACSVIPVMSLIPDPKATAPMLDGFGDNTLVPSQINPAAMRLFSQGMSQVYAFNGTEAIRAFKAALALDPNCAMCAWGVAYQMGPNINNPSRGDFTEALRYVDYAMKHNQGASPRDQALIESLALRYAHGSVKREIAPLIGEVCTTQGGSSERANPLDVAYAEKLGQLVDLFPQDPDVLSIYAEAEMVATTTDWWDRETGKPSGKIGALADKLEAALKYNPNHTGLNHYMIHGVDALQVASRAIPSADRLGKLAPKSPHLLHMPSHTYAQVGRYADATRVNQLAVAADETMMEDLKSQKFSVSKDWRGHNRHFQWYGALMEGRGELALTTARTAANSSKGKYTYYEYMRSLPILTLMYLQRWEDIQKEAMPNSDEKLARVISEMAHGIAFIHANKLDEANAAFTRLQAIATDLIKTNSGMGFNAKMITSLVHTAQYQLMAEIALASNKTADAIQLQSQAAIASHFVDGNEPPMLAGAARRRLGAMQTLSKQYPAAEQSYRKDLVERPLNGWALQGLSAALIAQGKQSEANALKSDLERSWKLADASLRISN
jgi:tetratricopeptide (TPR) repeat protein